MPLDPTDYRTWTDISEHPIFSDAKLRISEWSHDPSCYSEPGDYGRFVPDYYAPVDPALPRDEQLRIAERDIRNLASACAEIEITFGLIRYELVVLDDLTIYVWVQHPQFSIALYPNCLPNEGHPLKLFVDSPRVEGAEYDCETVKYMMDILRRSTGI